MEPPSLPLAVKLASIITHLLEYEDTGEPTDLRAARALLDDPEVGEFMDGLQAAALLPVRR